jgi:hypothetical protein
MNASERFAEDMRDATPQTPQGETPHYQNGYLDRATKIARRNPLVIADMNADKEALALFAHVLKGRTLGEFFAAVGLSKPQALRMTAKEIEDFTANAENNALDDPNGPPSAWKAKVTEVPQFLYV